MKSWMTISELAYIQAQKMRRSREFESDREEMELFLHHETDRAILVSEFGIKEAAHWMPKSQTFHRVLRKGKDDLGKTVDIVEIEAPVWLLKEKGFI